jgi:hypothetical protein
MKFSREENNQLSIDDIYTKWNNILISSTNLMTSVCLIICWYLSKEKLAWRHKFTYQVIRSLVSMRHFILKIEMSTIFEMRIWLYWSYHYHCCDILSLMYIFRLYWEQFVSLLFSFKHAHMYIYIHPDDI